MNLTEGFVRDSVFIDFGSEVSYGSDQVYVDYPCRFATVGFQLISTEVLAAIADRIRAEAGYRPMHPMEGYPEPECDQEGWYDFYIGINDLACTKTDTCIEFVVVNSASDDDEERYTIDLDDREQAYVYGQLDRQCRKYLGKTCDELLAEAKKQMEEDDAYDADEKGASVRHANERNCENESD